MRRNAGTSDNRLFNVCFFSTKEFSLTYVLAHIFILTLKESLDFAHQSRILLFYKKGSLIIFDIWISRFNLFSQRQLKLFKYFFYFRTQEVPSPYIQSFDGPKETNNMKNSLLVSPRKRSSTRNDLKSEFFLKILIFLMRTMKL